MSTGSKNEPAEVLVLHYLLECRADKVCIDADSALSLLRCLVADRLEQSFENRVQPSGADILGRLVALVGDIRDRFATVRTEVELDAIRFQQGLVLARQRAGWFGENPDKVIACQIVQLDPDREPSLQIGHQVCLR